MSTLPPTFSRVGYSNNSYRSCGMFCNFSGSTLDDFNAIGTLISLPAGAILLREEDPVNQVFVICKGQVKLSCISKEGKNLNCKIAMAGDLIGLVAVISDSLSEFTAETLSPTVVKVVPRKDFLAFVRGHYEACMHALSALAAEYKSAHIGARRLALSGTVAGRVAGLFLDWGYTASEGRSDLRFVMTLTHDDLADFTCSTRETISRTLGQFQKDNLILIRGASIHILAPEKLAKLSA
jgi:CRP/FNR family transcriptional regulator, cyclic AMP receptor protein